MKDKREEKIKKLFNGEISIKIENGDVNSIKISGTNYGIELALTHLVYSLKKYIDKEDISYAVNLALNTNAESLKKEKVSKEGLNKLINKLFE